jgi:hypothetical protein
MEWKLGPPTEVGLFVIEWASTGGLGIYVIHTRRGELEATTTDHISDAKGGKLKKWSISRHFKLPRPAAFAKFCPDINGAQVYEEFNDPEKTFDLNTGTYGGHPPMTAEEALACRKELMTAFGQRMTPEAEIEFLESYDKD